MLIISYYCRLQARVVQEQMVKKAQMCYLSLIESEGRQSNCLNRINLLSEVSLHKKMSSNTSNERSYFILLQCTSQGSKLTFCSGASWRVTEKFWLPTYFIYNSHKNRVLYVTLHPRKVRIKERKQLETTRVTVSYEATVVLR